MCICVAGGQEERRKERREERGEERGTGPPPPALGSYKSESRLQCRYR